MKKLYAIAAVAALAMTASPALAAPEVNINLQGVASGQLQNGNVTQNALSVAAAVGNTANDVEIASTAVSAAQLATMDIDNVQGNADTANINAMAAGLSQTVNGAINQASTSLAGSGALGAGGSISSTAANIGQSGNITVRVRQ